MKKIYGDYSFIPGRLDTEEACKIIPGTFKAIFESLVRGIEIQGGKPDLSKIEIIYHTPEDRLINPLDQEPVENATGQWGTTIGVKLKADFQEEGGTE